LCFKIILIKIENNFYNAKTLRTYTISLHHQITTKQLRNKNPQPDLNGNPFLWLEKLRQKD